jgi:hypothetical protein
MLTGHPRGGPSAGGTDTRPLDFGDREALVNDLAGAHANELDRHYRPARR